jgi:hypothetical protein
MEEESDNELDELYKNLQLGRNFLAPQEMALMQ